MELPDHISDGAWHDENKDRYDRVLRTPTVEVIEELRIQYVRKLDTTVAETKRNLSILKKNDYGQGGYYDHYWAAFYDREAKSKTKSCQLFFRMLGKQRVCRYGFALGNYCEEYIANLHAAIRENVQSVVDYVTNAPDNTVFRIDASDDDRGRSKHEFVQIIQDGKLEPSSSVDVVHVFPLSELPERAPALVEEIGTFFEWVWPFFQASRTGQWSVDRGQQIPSDAEDDEREIDEGAPRTLVELSNASALPIEQLRDIEDALLTKQQVILTGPPGTSKTYIAQLFARHFVADRKGQAQGKCSTLFMHANWAYEDFFEGIKPLTRDGQLQFEPRPGFFLDWIDSLKDHDPTTRHVLVLDEINRCDTASVLGELLQLLEYRGRDVRLLSGRMFRFPRNVYIVGTMNSADRSIGRMDLALRRRFLWVDLTPNYEVLQTWLSRTGNNRSRFSADALRQCNALLSDRGIPPQQQVGHALFMVQTFGSETKEPADKPLLPETLRRIVKFSVVPYVAELCLMQFGRPDSELVRQVETTLLKCLTPSIDDQNGLDDDG